MSETAEQAKHTPGPWELDNADGTIRSKTFIGDTMGDYRGSIVCDLTTALGTSWEHPARRHAKPECIANARLIAAAPELLEACKDVIQHWGAGLKHLEVGENNRLLVKMCEAANKAEGRR